MTEDALWGNVVEVEDANGITWRYCGLTAPAGAIPAETSGENHLHLECIKDGAYLDPEGLL